VNLGEPGSPIPPPAGGLGRAQPARRGMGKAGFPRPSPGGRVWAGAARAQGDGESRFPQTLTRWEGVGGRSPRAGAWGNRVSPHSSPRAYGHVRRSCAWRTTPDENGPGARASRPRHVSAGTVPAPSRTLPHRGREPGSSPQRGEAGRGAERGERWSPQPSMRLAPHHAAMKMLFLGGRSPPTPSRGWGHGETRFPHAPAGRGRGETRFPHTPRRGRRFTLAPRHEEAYRFICFIFISPRLWKAKPACAG